MYTWRVMKLRPKEIETYGNDHSKKFLYFLVEETIHLWVVDKKKKTYVQELQLVRNCKQNVGRGSKLVKSNRVCLYGLLRL